jgi:hypothetical protein
MGVLLVGNLLKWKIFSTYLRLKMSHLIFGAGEQLSISLQGKDTSLQEATTCSTRFSSMLS